MYKVCMYFVLHINMNISLYFQGKEVIEYYINELLEEGVTYIPPFVAPPSTETSPVTEPELADETTVPQHTSVSSRSTVLRSVASSGGESLQDAALVVGAEASDSDDSDAFEDALGSPPHDASFMQLGATAQSLTVKGKTILSDELRL